MSIEGSFAIWSVLDRMVRLSLTGIVFLNVLNQVDVKERVYSFFVTQLHKPHGAAQQQA